MSLIRCLPPLLAAIITLVEAHPAHCGQYVPPAVMEPGAGELSLAPHMEWLEDSGGQLSISDVAAPGMSERFQPLGERFYSEFITSSAFWYRVTIKNTSSVKQHLVLQSETPWLDTIELYEPDRAGGYTVKRGGDGLPFSQRDISHHTVLFDAHLNPWESRTLHIRVTSVDAFLAPFTLWTDAAFAKKDRIRIMYFGVILGIVAVMFFYNLLLMLFLRDRSYLQYNIYLAALAVWFFTYNGFSYQYIWPDFPWLQNRMMVSFDYIMQLCAVLFARAFLDTGRTIPSLDKVFRGAIWFYAVMIAVDLLTPFHYATGFICLIALQLYGPLLAVSGLIALRAGIRSARFYLIAWISTTIGVSLTALIVVGALHYNFWLFRAGEFGVMVDIFLLALALADRINILRGEKDSAQVAAREILEKSKAELAAKVAERTVELKEARDRAEAATRLKDKFVNLVSHDLKSPLGAIQGMLGLVNLDDEAPSAKAKNMGYLGRASAAAEGLTRMIDQLLNLSRIKMGEITPLKRFFPARDRVEALIGVMEPLAAKKGIGIINQTPREMRLLADVDLWQEVIRNLLSNSIKFCGAGDTVTIYSPPGWVNTVAVRDTGPGIEPEMMNKLFSHMERTTTVGSAGERGSGLGLPFSYEIMRAHGGALTARPTPGGGVEFVVSLPESKALLLLVDDQEVHRKIMREATGAASHIDILEAEDGVEALEILKLARPNVVVTDVFMPNINGLELLKMMKASAALSSIPVVVSASVANYDGDENKMRDKALSLGAEGFVVKPISPDEFMRAIGKYIG